ncbi:MAG: hypothetical protein V3V60_10620 [Sphingomonas aquatilis]|uniref:hypothetical protein n=1 Tax=Sphingomonas aquatilis TaxID=93063 RepID=UPI002F2E39A1
MRGLLDGAGLGRDGLVVGAAGGGGLRISGAVGAQRFGRMAGGRGGAAGGGVDRAAAQPERQRQRDERRPGDRPAAR